MSDITITRLTVRPIEGKTRLVGAADISINDAFRITGIRILKRQDGELFVDYPSRQTADGRYVSIAYPVTSEVRTGIEELILAKYRESVEGQEKAEG